MTTSGPEQGVTSGSEATGNVFSQEGMGDLWKSGAALRAQSFGPATNRMLDLAQIEAGDRVLDVAAGTGDYDNAHRVAVGESPEQVAQLGVGGEGQRVLLLRPVQGHGADAALDLPPQVLGGIADGVRDRKAQAGIEAGRSHGRAHYTTVCRPATPPARAAPAAADDRSRPRTD